MGEYKPEKIIKGESENISSVEFGLTKEQLIPGLHFPTEELATVATTGDYNDLINTPTIPTVNTPVIGQFSFSTTGNKVITGVGFTPKLVMFQVTIGSRSGCGQMTTTTQNAISYNDGPTTSYCIYIRDGGGTLSGRGTYVSMDSDGFTVNIDTASGTTVYVNYTCFG